MRYAKALSGSCASIDPSSLSSVKTGTNHQVAFTTLFPYMCSLGYRGSFINGTRILPIERFDVAVHQHQNGEWFWKKPGYCNNFIFEPAAELKSP